MDIASVLERVSAAGIRLGARDGQLEIAAPNGALTGELRALLSEHKAAVLRALERHARGDGPVPVARDAALAPSPAQQRLWFIEQLEGTGAAYVKLVPIRLRGALDAAALERAVGEIVRRHEVLRSTFDNVRGEPALRIHAHMPVEVAQRAIAPHALDAEIAHEAQRPFTLDRGPLLRVTLLQLGADEHVLVFAIHHIVSDGWSMGILVAEFSALYAAFHAGKPSPLPELSLQYADYGVWQHARQHSAAAQRDLLYWREQLRDAPTLLELPTDRPRPPRRGNAGAIVRLQIDAATTGALRALAQRHQASLFMLLQAAFKVLLARHSGQQDIVLGTPIANRDRAELEPLIGFFAGTAVLRDRVDPAQPFADFLAQVRATTLAAFQHQNVAFEQLVDAVQPARSTSHTPLFQVSFALQNVPIGSLALPGLVAEPIAFDADGAKFDLSLELEESAQGLRGIAEYDRALFDAETIERLLRHYSVLLQGILADPSTRLGDLPLLDADERRQLLTLWNETDVAHPQERFIHDLVAAQAQRTPHATALEFEDRRLSYAEFDAACTRLARYLRGRGVRADMPVAVLCRRSVEMVVALHAIVRAGGAYLPLDPDLPQDRLRYMLEDSGARLLLTHTPVAALAQELAMATNAAEVIDLERDAGAWAHVSDAPLDREETGLAPLHLAYVIYTSGSTGRPKGCLNTHAGILNRLLWMQWAYPLGPTDAVLQKTPYGFDVSVWEFFWPLMFGARLAIARPDGHRDPAYLRRTIAAHGITTLHFVPSMLQAFVDGAAAQDLGSLRRVICSGEALPGALAAQWLALAPHCELHNLYGPTEAAIDVSYWPCRADAVERGVRIGRPIHNLRLYVLDAALQPVPIGVAGQLYIAGIGLGRGYLNRADLTAAAFLPDPHARVPGERLYATGDLARFGTDGAIEYLGRIDSQVKLRGFRIELGEIDHVLAQHPAVREAVTVLRGTGDTARLVAFVSFTQAPSTAAELREWLGARLPEYMLPAQIVALDRLPLSANGKVDRKALPATDNAPATADYVAPRDAVERDLAAIWADVLQRERVGVEDDFFAIGGHSLLATRVIARVRETFGQELPVRALFEASTVAALARRLGAASADDVPLVPVARDVALPLSVSQQRLWFLEQLDGPSATFNIPVAIDLDGALDVAALRAALQDIVDRHEALRTAFADVDGQPMQRVLPACRFDLPLRDASDDDVVAAIAHDALRPFDLGEAPLLRAQLLRVAPARHVLLLAMHHIVSDGWSLNVLVEELSAGYAARLSGTAATLPPLSVQYGDFAHWQRQRLSGARLAQQIEYWQGVLGDAPAPLPLPTDRPRPALQTHRGAVAVAHVSLATLDALRALATGQGASLFMLLLAAFDVLLARYSGTTDICVGSAIANRTRRELEPLIGFFVNTLVLRTEVDPAQTFLDLLAQVRERVLDAYAHQDVPFEQLVETLQPARSLSHTPWFQAMLVLQNTPRTELALPGLALRVRDPHIAVAKTDLSLYATELAQGLRFDLEYNTDLFDAATMQRLLRHFGTLLESIVQQPSVAVGRLALLDAAQRRQQLEVWNATPSSEPATRDVVQQFHARVQATPHVVAVEQGDVFWTYAELAARAAEIAHALRGRGVNTETRVALALERSPALIAALLGVLEAGAVYVPLDLRTPFERTQAILADAGCALLLADAAGAERCSAAGLPLLNTDAIGDGAAIAGESPTVPHSQQAAYVIYTSGSGGRPKGVEITHVALAAFCAAARTRYGICAADRVLQFASIAFDASVEEIFPTLLAGATLVLRDDAMLDTLDGFVGRSAELGVTLWDLPTAFWQQLAAQPGLALPPALRAVIIGGERADAESVARWRTLAPAHVRLFNTYGPTETTVVATAAEIAAAEAIVPIGRPLAGVTCYVLDDALEPLPLGASGELYIGGEALARGYLGCADLTAAAFVPHPFSKVPGARLYRSGDRVRYRGDGTLEFVGRADRQVKIRGFRVEPAEIEAALLQCAGVEHAIVRARPDTRGQPALVAHVASQRPAQALLDELRARLPEYLIPAQLMCLPQLPLNASGKIDTAALPEPEAASPAHDTVAPRNARERVLAEIFAEVLGVTAVGVHDDFFRRGGHSLLATQVVARARARLGLKLSIKTLFERPTVAGLAELDGNAPEAPLVPVPRDGRTLPLSHAQQRLWFLEQLQGPSATYNMPAALRLSGTLDVAALHSSIQAIVDRHETLRTQFVDVDGTPQQCIVDRISIEVPLLAVAEHDVPAVLNAFAQTPFDLTQAPLLRAQLLQLGPDEHVLLTNMHHIVSDGWSIDVLVAEFVALYTASLGGDAAALRPLPIQYADFALWQRERLQGAVLERQLDYWRGQLAELPALLELPTDRPRPPVQTHAGALHTFMLPSRTVDAMTQLCRREGATPFMGLLAVLQLLLARLAGQDDVAVGTPIANRTRQELEPLIGFFVNTLVLRTRVDRRAGFRALLAAVRNTTLQAYENQDVPFEQLVETLQPERSLSHSPLFQVAFALQNNRHRSAQLPGLTLSALEPESRVAKFDLTLELQDADDGLVGQLEYNTDLFDAATVERIGRLYARVLDAIVQAPERPLGEIALLDAAELRLWQEHSAVPAPAQAASACLQHRFEQWARQTPDADALVCGSERVTYRELDRRANGWAQRLLDCGVRSEACIAIGLAPSVDLVVAILATLKAGAAYLVIDPTQPAERCAAMLASARPACVIGAGPEWRAQVPREIPVLDSAERVTPADHGPAIRVSPEQLAYVIFTSGSTGTPKGVMIEHARAWALLQGFAAVASARGPVSALAPTAFDVSVWELFSALCFGNCAHLLPKDATLEPERVAQYWHDASIATGYLPPALIEPMVALWEAQPQLAGALRCLLVGVEPIPAALLARLRRVQPHTRVINGYGPTETAVCATLHRTSDADSGRVPLGRAVPGYAVYLLDDSGQPVPTGVAGEIVIGGAGVGRGYLGDPALTAEKFRPDPFSPTPGARCYRSGDLARRDADGVLHFIGRRDAQIKLRGFRIELGEIEAALAAQPDVRRAVVLLHEQGSERHLVAYVVAPESVEPTALREGLRGRLPEYMLPAAIVRLHALPLTANGKIDRKALPKPDVAQAGYQAPQTPTEQQLAGLWSEVLKRDRIGRDDNFFALGGHSLLGTQIVVRARRAFAREIPVRQLFETPTVAGFAAWLDAQTETVAESPLVPVPRDGRPLPLSHAQQRLWFLEQLQGPSATYNMPAALRLSGSLDVAALRSSIQAIVDRHETLRTQFVDVDGTPQQCVVDGISIEVPVLAVAEHDVPAALNAFAQTPFDLTQAPLLRAQLLQLGPDEHVLLTNMHHIVSDGWSIDVLVAEFVALYTASVGGNATALRPLPIQYADFALWQRERLQGAVLERQLDYWRGQLAELPALLELPTDRPRPPVQTHAGALHTFMLPSRTVEAMTQLCRREGATPFMGLLAVLQLLLARLAGQDDVAVGTPIANRTRQELEPLIGFFVNTLVLRTRVDRRAGFRALLAAVRATTLLAYENQDVPFEQLVETLQPERSLSHSPLFQAAFALQNGAQREAPLPGLKLSAVEPESRVAKFDLTLMLQPTEDGLLGQLEYNTDLFDAATVERIGRYYVRLVDALVERPERATGEIALLDAPELHAWRTHSVVPAPASASAACLHQRFEQWARETPDAVALVCGDRRLTYRELDCRANGWAQRLLASGVTNESCVAIGLGPSVELVVAILATLKAGAAYLVIDPEQPAERCAAMLATARPACLIGDASTWQERVPQGMRLLDSGMPVPPADSAPAVAVDPEQLAYIIYTSGSTGTPKGVMIEHARAWAMLQGFAQVASARGAVSVVGPIVFDVSVWELFSALCFGNCAHLLPKDATLEPERVAQYWHDASIATGYLPPALIEPMVALWEAQPQLAGALRCLLVGVEPIPAALLARLRRVQPHAQVINAYGPTETAVCATLHRTSDADSGRVPLGRAVPGYAVYLLDDSGQPVPTGVAGEIVIGGAGVGRGYLGDPSLTAEKFLPDPFSPTPGARCYRSGDLARRDADGVLHFIGRRDAQIKLRGFRIELGEIEAALSAQPDVRRAVVLLHEQGGERHLVAYVVAPEGVEPTALREALRGRLPEYMLPAVIVRLDALPLTANGKIDRKALPKPDVAEADYQAPQTDTEQQLAELWSEVLKRDRIGRDDNFFALGGHSLLGTQIVVRARRAFAREIPVRQLFETPTIAGFAAWLDAQTETVAESPLVPVPRDGRPLPLSHAQQRLWFLQQLHGASAAYNMPAALRLRGELDVEALRRAYALLIERHELLRARFDAGTGEPVMCIDRDVSAPLALVDIGADALEAHVRAHAAHAFDLERGPLVRADLLRLDADDHVLLFNVHHIAADGWSLGLLVDEWVRLYAAVHEGRAPTLPPLAVQYADYAHWQRSAPQVARAERQLEYWQRQLAGAAQVLQLPTDRPRVPLAHFEGAAELAVVDPFVTAALNAITQREGATLFMTLLSAFAVLLARHSGQDDFLIGTPHANRERPELENLVGLFLDTLVLRADLTGAPAFEDLLRRMRRTVLDAFAHADVPFERIVDAVGEQRDLSRNPLFQVFFNMLNLPAVDGSVAGLDIEGLSDPAGDAKFDLTLYAAETERGIELRLLYNAQLFAPARMRDLLDQYVLLLRQIARKPAAPIGAYDLVTTRARQVLPDPTAALDRSWRGAVHEQFARHAAARPHAPALLAHDGALSYAELDDVSDRIAAALQKQGIGRSDIVAIHAARALALPAALLGTMKTGAAFLLLDPAYPTAHMRACLDVAPAQGWIQLAPARDETLGAACRAYLDLREGAAALRRLPAARPHPVSVGADDVALIAFTSGSTGRPKAVESRHGPLTHYLPWVVREFGLDANDRWSMLSGLAHDPLQRDVFSALCLGACVAIPHPEQIVPGELAAWFRTQGITAANLTPAMAQILCDAGDVTLPALRNAFLVGDVLTRRTVRGLQALAPAVRVVGYYGATETQRAFGYHDLSTETALHAARDIVPLGRGIGDVQLLVLNAAGALTGIGECGEVHLRSPHLARGYRDDPQATAARFLPNPFTQDAHDRVYRTGDLGRYLPDGAVEGLGRADTQVKLRGFRIELGEIEAALGRHPDVRESVVVLRGSGEDKRLVAYVCLRAEDIGDADLRSHLRAHLPDHMQPAAYVRLRRLPLSPNGKIDRRALPEPTIDAPQALDAAPEPGIEQALAALWCAVLKRDAVGRFDNFFEIGGHSLLATQVVSRVRRELGLALDLRDVFDAPVLHALAARIGERRGEGLRAAPIPRVARDAPIPLSFAQQRLWFLERLHGASATYNMPAALRLRGSLDVAALRASIAQIVARHETLRTRFDDADGIPVQRIADAVEIDMPLIAARESELGARLAAFARTPFDLRRGPLLRAALLRLAPDDHVLLTNMHHIVSDGWSIGVLVEEFCALYAAACRGADAPLPPLAVQYADFASWQRQWLEAGEQERQLAYWRRQLADLPPLLELPTDRPRPALQTHAGALYAFDLPAPLVARARAFAQTHGATEFMLLLAAFQALLARYTNHDDIAVGTPIANRTRHELESLIGFFVNTLVLRTPVDLGRGLHELVGAVRATTLAAYDHQDLPFEHLVEALQPARSLSHAPLFQVMFVLQNTPAAAQELPGLRLEPIDPPRDVARFDLTLTLQPEAGAFAAAFEYNTDLFERDTIAQLARHFVRLLDAALERPEHALGALPMLTPEERLQRVSPARAVAPPPRADRSLHALITEQAQRTPDAVALTQGDASVSYADLERRSNRLARHLRALGVGRGDRVALCIERGPDLVAALLATLKAGAAYVPLDPAYPVGRLLAMQDDSAPRALVLQAPAHATSVRALHDAAQAAGVAVCDLRRDAARIDACADGALEPASSGVGAHDAAYVIYTSGSTGTPKGVLVEHGGWCDLAQAQGESLALDPGSRVLQFASPGFDAFAWELSMSLCHGATLCFAAPDTLLAGAAFVDTVRAHGITHATVPPVLLAGLDADVALPSLRVLIAAGEALPETVAQAWSRRCRLINAYGPTEATVCATWQDCVAGAAGAPPIGRALPHAQVYVLDAYGEPVPNGVAGELHIGGSGVARGYLGRAALSAERFVPDPFIGVPGARLYRTGDVARQRADGTIEFLGRNDHQVKLRGYRIELGEIESRLRAVLGVREALVLARPLRGNDAELVAYLVADTAPETAALRAHLAATLPDYMLPSAFVTLAAWPLTPNGKIDRRALPQPESAATDTAFAAPQSAAEIAAAAVWADVLGVERVGREDNFFELGGHSLRAVAMVERLRRDGLHGDVRALFTAPTLAAFAATLGAAALTVAVPANGIVPGEHAITPAMLPLTDLRPAEIERIVAAVPGGARNVQDIYPLTPLQEGIFFHHMMSTQGDVYLTPFLFAIRRRDHLQRYLDALQAVIDRHDILRTAVVWEGLREPMQVVWRHAPLAVEEIVLDPAHGDIAAQLRARFDPSHHRIDVRQAPLRRVIVSEDRAHGRWVVLELMHHLTSDHATLEILKHEIEAHLLGRAEQLPAPLPFRNFVAQARADAARAAHAEFFRAMLGDVTEPTVPPGLGDGASDGRGIAQARVTLERDLSLRVRSAARRHAASAASVLHVAWAQVLARISARDDVVFGTVLFGRLHGGAADAVLGMFINTLPVRVRLAHASVAELLRTTHGGLNDLLRHEHAPLVVAQQASGVRAPLPLFTALLNYRHTAPETDALALPDEIADALGGVDFLGGHERTNYPLMLAVDDFGEDFALTAQVDGAIDPQWICALMQTALAALSDALEREPARAAHTIDVLPHEERRRVLHDWNATRVDAPRPRLQELFAAQRQRDPHAPALRCGGTVLSYAELDRRASRVAQRLRAAGIGVEHRVALCAERGVEMVIALLGILKAGAAYVPLDPEHPRERLRYVLGDSAPALLLCHLPGAPDLAGELAQAAADAGVPVRAIEALDRESRDDTASLRNELPHDGSELAYVLYTSGSTGKPKGVMIAHDALSNLLIAFRDRLGVTAADRVLALTTLSFDIAGLELLLPLAAGACCVLVDGATARDPAGLAHTIAAEAVSIVQATPATWRLLLDAGWSGAAVHALCGGEAMSDALADTLAPRVRSLTNVYGPTETTIWSTAQSITTERAAGSAGRQPIGRPLANTQVYLLDAHGMPVPVGVPGEIHIGGAGVARGYVGRPDLSAERFVPDPFGGMAGVRMYRTGDLGRWRSDGTLEFLGRNDHQVKLRGYRIELGEIESRLREHLQVRDAVVLAREDRVGEPRLVAYVLASTPLAADDLRAHAAATLPEYMLPSAFVTLEAWPLTPNGKLDRRALPAPEAVLDAVAFEAPQSATEIALAALWSELLGRERIGRHDDFFALGGHSLLLIRLLTRLRSAFGLDVAARQVFSRSTLSAMAALIDAFRSEAWSPLVTLQAGDGTRAPLAIVHAQGGGVEPYAEFARQLGAEFTVYGLQAQGLEPGQAPLRDVAAIAESYVAALRQAQPQGPYFLLGYSLGGSIAFEMARQLHASGASVALLGLIDSTPPDAQRRRVDPTRADLLAEVWGDALGFAAEDLRALDADAQVAFVLDRAKAAGAVPAEFDHAAALRQAEVVEALTHAVAAYAPGPYAGDAVLFRAGDSTPAELAARWRPFVRALRHETLAADHFNLLLPPRVAELAARVRAVLAAAPESTEALAFAP